MGQFKHTVRLIRLPMPLFLKLADDIGNSKSDVCCILSTGRCGSTILAQALEKIPGTLLHAEPDCLTNLGRIWKSKSITQSRYEQMVVAIIRILCKPYHDISRVIIKTRSCSTCHIDALQKHFPNLKIIFMYRSLASTISSNLRIPYINKTSTYVRRYLLNNNKFSVLFPWLRRSFYYKRCYPLEKCPLPNVADSMNKIELLTYAWASNTVIVRQFLQKGGLVFLTTYEELTDKKTETLQSVLEQLDIDVKQIRFTLAAFNQDSQQGTMLSWANKEGKQNGIITKSNHERADKVLLSFDLPDINAPVSYYFSNIKENMMLDK